MSSRNPLIELTKLGQSVWLDQMRRSLLTSGELQKLISNDGLGGMTSNPTIFEKAIGGSADYQKSLEQLAARGASVNEIYEALVVEDIGAAGDVLKQVYDSRNGADGFVSLEVSPLLAHETQKTIDEAKKLFSRLNRPNVMIKIPATPEGLPAIEESIAAGLNINITLIFSVEVYEKVAEAYVRGLERRVAAGQPIDRIGSVASFFVSRIDTAVDKELEALAAKATGAEKERILALQGKTAIANAKLAYQSFKRIFDGERFAKLKAKGAKVQRPLWASTSTKNPNYLDVIYIETLIGPDTVNTMPPQTVDAYRDHGKPQLTLEHDVEGAHKLFSDLAALGIDFKKVTERLTADGVKSFADSFNDLFKVIEARRDEAQNRILARHTAAIGKYENALKDGLKELADKQFPIRLWKKDATLWKTEEAHTKIISSSLGWLRVAEDMQARVTELKAFAEEIRNAGFEYAVVLGMGGSSLCPEVFRQTFKKQNGYPELFVLDSTVPAAVRDLESRIRIDKTLFIVASKSGSTTEPQMFYRYFFHRTREKLADRAGQNFVAITDPNTQLQKEAERDKFRKIWINPADIGGRYSALSLFGLVPLAVMGGDVEAVLDAAVHAMHACAGPVQITENPGAKLGAVIGVLARSGRDKLTFIIPPPIDSLGLWIEQLVAESTGKEGKGIVPVAREPLGTSDVYGDDRVFVYIRTEDAKHADIEQKLAAFEKAGHPVLGHVLRNPKDLGEEFFLWEIATAVAGYFLGINPFDQPNVQESKDNTKRLLAEYQQRGALNEQTEVISDNGIRVLTDERNNKELHGKSLDDVLESHLARVKDGDYVAITQYFEEKPEYDALLQELRIAIRDNFRVATTTGYGPRFLHSTGQLHKGGADNGVFIQLTAADANDVELPGEKFTFGVLAQAQALGDFESLSSRNRRAIRVDLGRDIKAGLVRVLAATRKAAQQRNAVTAR